MNFNKNRLFYHDTNIEVLEGDYISKKPLLSRKYKHGRVSYIPTKTAPELSKENKQPDEWVIEYPDKSVDAWIYHPEDLQPIKRIKFLKRKDDTYEGINSEELERVESELQNEPPSKLESLYTMIFVGIIVLIMYILILV